MPIVNAVYSGEVLVVVMVLLMKIMLVVSMKMWI